MSEYNEDRDISRNNGSDDTTDPPSISTETCAMYRVSVWNNLYSD